MLTRPEGLGDVWRLRPGETEEGLRVWVFGFEKRRIFGDVELGASGPIGTCGRLETPIGSESVNVAAKADQRTYNFRVWNRVDGKHVPGFKANPGQGATTGFTTSTVSTVFWTTVSTTVFSTSVTIQKPSSRGRMKWRCHYNYLSRQHLLYKGADELPNCTA